MIKETNIAVRRIKRMKAENYSLILGLELARTFDLSALTNLELHILDLCLLVHQYDYAVYVVDHDRNLPGEKYEADSFYIYISHHTI